MWHLCTSHSFPLTYKCDIWHEHVTWNLWCRGKPGVCINLMVTLNVQWTSFTVKSEFHMINTEHNFSLKSGFTKIWWTLNMVSVLNLDSRKYSLYQTFLYNLWYISYDIPPCVDSFRAGRVDKQKLKIALTGYRAGLDLPFAEWWFREG